ncbi:hypothetical protein Riv7116_1854 [Rivularia sp. PCC 7116]|uniref:hypothetical protein n=1 Tax=Rivularia sp. PCC 7116 TaxID=373994 RepID=UPI00029EF708|nr:hypothetical protein [Rivularia sp. PCC 7116]AFY54395.1 hypothetical protein Riv7116_1854 [Rivularia sp. PCC 7116]
MRDFNISDLIAIGSLVITAISGIIAAAFWYANTEKRKYGLERDFAHLKNNYAQIQQSLNQVLTELDHRFDVAERDILEIKSVLNNLKKEGSK